MKKACCVRWVAGLATGAIVFQTAGCPSSSALQQIAVQVGSQELIVLLTDVIFFFLDNALVRLTA
jgi:hypothetical protein